MGAVWRACGTGQGSRGGAGIIRGEEQVTFPALPRDPPQLPVMRCQICHRTVAYRPRNLSEVLTGHYRRAVPKRSASLPGSRPPGTGLPATETSTDADGGWARAGDVENRLSAAPHATVYGDGDNPLCRMPGRPASLAQPRADLARQLGQRTRNETTWVTACGEGQAAKGDAP
jgi:hypothetical protein